ncbi:MAG: efflux RND transporter periplasmic adaptor subunit [Candidatus Dadabacteria bacterium]|nr:efflux RND transporter periplasmic adaptor subunit [Candidatus Dadabacteria bacterium]NIQ13204.1 efflux RND transporter periplasmic adaptor subunit [Candidatus Dadabacteria bacterium]
MIIKYKYPKYILFIILSFIFYVNKALPQVNGASPVVVSEVKSQNIKNTISLVGTVYPIKKSVISNEVEGIVKKVHVNDGDYITAGRVIAEINNKRLKLELKEVASGKYEADSRYELAIKEYERVIELFNKGIASKRELDNASAEKDALKARVSRLESEINKIKYDLNASKIYAPFNGYVTKEFTEVGQWLERGSEVIEIIDIDKIEIRGELPEKYIKLVRQGDDVEVIINSLDDKIIKAKIDSIVPEADLRARTFPIKVILKNSDHLIRSSASSTINVFVGGDNFIKLLPKDSIIDVDGSKIVYVVRNDIAEPVPIKVMDWYGDSAHFEGGLQVGEKVVIRGNERLRPKQKVKIVE